MRLEYFEMIDTVTSFDKAGEILQATSIVPSASPVFEGHFPGHPLVPGVLLTETMAQASGYLLLGLANFEFMPFLAGVEKAKFRNFVGPNTVLSVEAKVLHHGSGYAVTKAKIRADNKPLCDSELMFKTLPFPADMKVLMQAQARRIDLMRFLEHKA